METRRCGGICGSASHCREWLRADQTGDEARKRDQREIRSQCRTGDGGRHGLRTVSSLTLERQICDEYGAILNSIAKKSGGTLAWTILGLALSQSLEFLIMALGFWYGAKLISSGEYTVTQFFVIFLAVVFGGQAAGQISGYLGSMASAQNAVNYLLWLRSLSSPFDEKENNTDDSQPPSDGLIMSTTWSSHTSSANPQKYSKALV